MITVTDLKFDDRGLIPAVIQHIETHKVLMVGWMNTESIRLTLENKCVHFWSRSRNTLWKKGETSGNIHKLIKIEADCDNDTLLLQVYPMGPTCHTGKQTCFFQKVDS